VLVEKNLSKKFKLGRFKLLSISKIGPCHTCTCVKTSHWEPWTCSTKRQVGIEIPLVHGEEMEGGSKIGWGEPDLHVERRQIGEESSKVMHRK